MGAVQTLHWRNIPRTTSCHCLFIYIYIRCMHKITGCQNRTYSRTNWVNANFVSPATKLFYCFIVVFNFFYSILVQRIRSLFCRLAQLRDTIADAWNHWFVHSPTTTSTPSLPPPFFFWLTKFHKYLSFVWWSMYSSFGFWGHIAQCITTTYQKGTESREREKER